MVIYASSQSEEGVNGSSVRVRHPGFGCGALWPRCIARPLGKEIGMDILALIVAAALFVYLLAALCKPEWFE
jgi:K+-transporting ATPase KdpF subunit